VQSKTMFDSEKCAKTTVIIIAHKKQ